MPPDPGALRSGDEKMAFTFWYAIGTLSMMAKNCSFDAAENPSTCSITSRRIVGSGVPVLISATIRSRARFSISGSARSILVRSTPSAT